MLDQRGAVWLVVALKTLVMRFVMAAMRNTRFLCAAIVVSVVIVILADMGLERIPLFHEWDIFELLIVLLGTAYLRVADHDEFRGLIKGLLYFLALMLPIMHIFAAE